MVTTPLDVAKTRIMLAKVSGKIGNEGTTAAPTCWHEGSCGHSMTEVEHCLVPAAVLPGSRWQNIVHRCHTASAHSTPPFPHFPLRPVSRQGWRASAVSALRSLLSPSSWTCLSAGEQRHAAKAQPSLGKLGLLSELLTFFQGKEKLFFKKATDFRGCHIYKYLDQNNKKMAILLWKNEQEQNSSMWADRVNLRVPARFHIGRVAL